VTLRAKRRAMRAGNALAVSAAVFGLIVAGLAAGLACDKPSAEAHESASGSMLGEVTGQLRVVAGEHGFRPTALSLAKGAPGSKVPVTFVRTTDKTCATEVVFPDLGIKKELPLDVPIAIDVPTDAPRTLSFQCGMAMYKGALVVK
jgi:plastocyanin domain-containing protein